MTTGHLLAIAWSPEPSVIGGIAALVVAYVAWLRNVVRFRLRLLSFLLGAGLLVVTLVSPIDRLGELYLFSVHMVQHMLLILVVPPLLLWGLPVDATRRLLRVPALDRLERVLGRPKVTLPVKILALYVWHIPAFYDLALRSEGVHALEHLVFVVTATMFWWPVLSPVRERRIAPQAAMLYLFGAMAGITLLGMALTLAPGVLYPFYLHPADPYGALPLIRDGWGVSAMADQQLGGLLMWIAGGLFYIVTILTEFGLWFREPDEDEDEGRVAVLPDPAFAATLASHDVPVARRRPIATEPASRWPAQRRRVPAGPGSLQEPAALEDTMEGAR